MLAQQVAFRCAQETGAARLSRYGEEVALIALATADTNIPHWKRTIRQEFRSRHPECGSILLMILLPILINLVTAWLAKWIFSEHPTSLHHLMTEAASALKS